jgi:hypothetical protein
VKFHSSGYDFFSETIELDRFILLPNKVAAEAFLNSIFPHISNCIVVSGDGVFPKHPEVRAKCLVRLAEDKNARVIVFNPETLKKIQVSSDRLLLIDDYLVQDVCWAPEDREYGFQLNPKKVAHFINTFFRQWEKVSGSGNFSFLYRNFNRLKWTESEWKLRLLVGDFDPIALEDKNPFHGN